MNSAGCFANAAWTAAIWFGEPSSSRCSASSSASAFLGVSPRRLVQSRLPRLIASGERAAISRGELERGSPGSSASRVTRPIRMRLGALDASPSEDQLLGHVEADEMRAASGVKPMSGIRPYLISRIEISHVGRRDSDVGAERQLGATADAVAVERGDHRNRQPLPVVGDALREVRRVAVAVDEQLLRDVHAVAAMKLGKSRPEQKLGPSPERTTARRPCVARQLVERGVEGPEHLRVEGVVLVARASGERRRRRREISIVTRSGFTKYIPCQGG